ncbi:YbfB/YjiJ family MFS transporter [Agrobacterium vitis]|uniref:YbfB/YjiJ family MFS transporter n=1 Tax=Agrobacterium vitis TaxID=373 RepID=A0A6L6VJM0_AGRVI|nr:YbfB/YjiJ family MFS transporter [Agrobacterium vitis]MUZ75281.1 YbfB/YjiJ family MFS transporter [Agrobacterium vitis]
MRNNERLAAIAAALVLVIGMGLGRFAFTGLYPLMVADGQISLDGGSFAASANYAGYLVGALLAALLSGIPSRRICSFAMVATVVSLGLLALPMPEWLIVLIRGISGAASAIAMVAASRWLIHDRRQHHASPALFSGVGLGILLSAELIAAGHAGSFTSFAIWLGVGVASLILAVLAIALQASVDESKITRQTRDDNANKAVLFGALQLITVYGLAGFGYIITATYLPLLVRDAITSVDPVHIWAVFGVGAIPSCFLWHALHNRWGTHQSLLANLLVQAVGVVLPIMHVPAAYLVSALLVGGTFMGTVTIAMPAAKSVAHQVRFNMLAILTASYGVGQIIGPLIASYLFGLTQSFDASLAVAGAVLAISALLCLPGSRQQSSPSVEQRMS